MFDFFILRRCWPTVGNSSGVRNDMTAGRRTPTIDELQKKDMDPTSGTLLSPDTSADAARRYERLGWRVSVTANGLSLVTTGEVCGIGLPTDLAGHVRDYLWINTLLGPVITLPEAGSAEIHLVTGIAHADLAVAALRAIGVVIYSDGALIPLPPTILPTGPIRWSVTPEAARWVPPVVAVSAAIRAVRPPMAPLRGSRRGRTLSLVNGGDRQLGEHDLIDFPAKSPALSRT